MKKVTLKIDGMMCGMCEAHVSDAIRKAADVQKVTASHTDGTAEVICDDSVDVEVLKAAVEKDGYKVLDVAQEEYEKKGLFAKMFKK